MVTLVYNFQMIYMQHLNVRKMKQLNMAEVFSKEEKHKNTVSKVKTFFTSYNYCFMDENINCFPLILLSNASSHLSSCLELDFREI